ncbi:MAG TPA: hypothetical protein VFZ59_02480, partial [Verrucomicrobiae bacterium]|nr:hypothetical protein [Verrucomicrobiae bacterium]
MMPGTTNPTYSNYYSSVESMVYTSRSATGVSGTELLYTSATYSGGPYDCGAMPPCVTTENGTDSTYTISGQDCEMNPSACATAWAALGNTFAGLQRCDPAVGEDDDLEDHFQYSMRVYDYMDNFQMCGFGTETLINQTTLSGKNSLTDFAGTAIAGAANHYSPDWDSAPTTGASLTFNGTKSCATTTVAKYRIKFMSKPVEYTVSWEILITSNKRDDEYIRESRSVMGDGKEMILEPKILLPTPKIDEVYTAHLVHVTAIGDESCSSGRCGNSEDSPGDSIARLGSVSLAISLGVGTIDEGAGTLRVEEDAPSTLLATTGALRFDINTNVVSILTNASNGEIYVAAPTVMARIVVSNSFAYWIHCSAKSGGIYLTNAPYISHLVMNPNGATNTNTLRHVRFLSGSAVTNEFVCEIANATNKTWTLTSGNGLKGERLSKISFTNDNTRLDSYSIFSPPSGDLYREDKLISVDPDGVERILSNTIDPAGLSLTTTNQFDTNGFPVLSVRPDGFWERKEYDSSGWLVRIVTPLTNQPPSSSANECRVTEFYNTPQWDTPSSLGQMGKPVGAVDMVRSNIVRKVMYFYPDEFETTTAVAATPDSTWDDPDNEVTTVRYDTSHRLELVINPDGTRESYTYSTNGAGPLTTIEFADSTETVWKRTEQQLDFLGRPISNKTFYIPAEDPEMLLEQELFSDPDEFARPTKIKYLDDSFSLEVKESCCSPEYSVDREGVTNTYTYDALKRLVAVQRLNITTSNILDAASRLRSQTRKGASGPTITLRKIDYDAAGRMLRETNALGAITSYGYLMDGSSQSVTMVTNADGGTRIETRFRDGNLASVTGTAAFPVRFVYGVTNDGIPRAFTWEIKLDNAGADTAEWKQTQTDGGGRTIKTIFRDLAVQQSFYNAKGQMWKDVDPDGVIRLFEYNTKGELEYTCIDSNRNGTIDRSGQDRVTKTVTEVTSAHGTNVTRTSTYVWETDGSDTGTLLSVVDQSVEGLKTWTEAAGVSSSSIRTLPVFQIYTNTQIAPDGSSTVTVYQQGRVLSVTQKDSGGGQIAKTTYGYDSHGRRNTATDARNGTTSFAFNDLDQIVSVTTPNPEVLGGGPQTTTSYLDSMNRATNVVQPDGTIVNNVFSPRGELLRTSGARTYPVGYAYDSQGRMKYMTNWGGFAAGSGTRVTAWHYHPCRGWLTNKVYNDGNGTKYSYTAAGRLENRLWARGTNTTYSYNHFGDLSGTSYNDGATPAVTYTYDRRGRQRTASKGSDSWEFFYTAGGQLLSEAGTGGTLNGLRMTNSFDQFLRRTNVATANGGTQLTRAGYGYDSAGRMSTARDGDFIATCSYLANSALISQIEFKSNTVVQMVTRKSYDKLNRLSSIGSTYSNSTALVNLYAYDYNNANQRTRVTLADGSFWIYQYDSLGQVTSGKRYWGDWTPVAGQQFEYGFDDIGNRTSAKTGGDQNGGGLRLSSLTNNLLNQVTGRTVPPYLNVIGAATATATNVNVNNTLAYRKGEYYRVELNPDNTAPVWQDVTNRVVENGTTNSVTGNLFLAATPEVFGYDADGNLTNDGRWAYRWDAENRLVQMIAPSSIPSGARLSLSFAYDCQGRRIRKTVTDSASATILDEKYLYDGWNLLASLNASDNSV